MSDQSCQEFYRKYSSDDEIALSIRIAVSDARSLADRMDDVERALDAGRIEAARATLLNAYEDYFSMIETDRRIIETRDEEQLGG